MLRVNLRPLFLLARAAAAAAGRAGGRRVRRRGRRAALDPAPARPPTTRRRPGVLAFIRSLDADYRDQGLRANAVLPSVIDTPANRAAMPDADHSQLGPPGCRSEPSIGSWCRTIRPPRRARPIPVYGRA